MLALGLVWPQMSTAQDESDEAGDPASHAQHKGKHSSGAPDLARQIAELNAKVAKLEVALKQNSNGTPSDTPEQEGQVDKPDKAEGVPPGKGGKRMGMMDEKKKAGMGMMADDDHAKTFGFCAKHCSACQLECASCFDHCMTHVAKGHKDHAATARMCADCEKCCALVASLCAGKSPLAAHLGEGCAKCCDDCAAACEKQKDDKQMAACAKTCRDCAKACRELAKHGMHKKE